VSPAPIRAVLFDMDGTLVDTLPDIAAAVNATLEELGLRALDQDTIKTLIGNGPRVLSRRALEAQASLDSAGRERLVDSLLAGYAQRYAGQLGKLGSAFPGVLECMRELDARGIKLGVVSNALQHLADAVLARFGIAPLLHVVIGGDSVTHHKPHPEPLRLACDRLGVRPHEALMVGDSINDVLAARAAGCPVVCVPHGYDQGQPVSELGCDIVPHFDALPAWIAQHDARVRALEGQGDSI